MSRPKQEVLWTDRIRVLSGAAVLVVFVLVVYWFLMLLSRASDTVVAAAITGFISIFAIFFARYLEQRRDLIQRASAERIRVYDAILKVFLSFFHVKATAAAGSEALGTTTSTISDVPDDKVNELRLVQSELFFWGSDDVIEAWKNLNIHLRHAADAGRQEDTIRNLAASLGLLARLVIAMRRDVGYPKTRLKEEDYARLILSSGNAEEALIELMNHTLSALDRAR